MGRVLISMMPLVNNHSMFYVFSKLLEPFLQPFNWLLLGIGFAIWKSKGRLRYLLVGMGLVLVGLSTPWLSNAAYRAWEMCDRPKEIKPNDYDAIVVLGGGTIYSTDTAGHDLHLGEADRLYQGVRLLQAGVAPRILVTGGGDPVSEADMARRVLLSMGIPDPAILIEPSSRTTWENAKFTAALVNKHPELFPRKRLLLVTSALHLPRAMWCFQRCGLPATAYPCDIHGSGTPPVEWLDRILWNLPSAGVFCSWDSLFHEWIGILSYRWRYGCS